MLFVPLQKVKLFMMEIRLGWKSISLMNTAIFLALESPVRSPSARPALSVGMRLNRCRIRTDPGR
jgi:hypothetical protein